MATMLVTEILLNSWQKQCFDLPLLVKLNVLSHIIVLEESHHDFFIPQTFISSNHKILDKYTTSQIWFAKYLLSIGLYHLSATIYQRINAHNQKVLGIQHPATLSSISNIVSTYWDQGRWKEARAHAANFLRCILRQKVEINVRKEKKLQEN